MDEVLLFLERPTVRAISIVIGAILMSLLLNMFIASWVMKLTAKTKTDLDDRIVASLRTPLFLTVLLLGAAWASYQFELKVNTKFVVYAALKSIAVVVWASALMKFGIGLLQIVAKGARKVDLIQPRTLPLFEIIVKVAVVGGAVYFALLAWKINVTGWLASAGIVGIAVGFAAKDTLANLFAGVFILADAPYKPGDFVVLDNGQRGKVTDIGFRSTRILTRDDIEITVPNAVIANSKIINESGGPWEKERVRVQVSVAYGSDVDRVRKILLSCVEEMPHVCPDPYPRVRFRSFGDSGLDFELMAWIDEPVLRGRVLDALNTRVYKELGLHDVEIPYPKRDLYIKEISGVKRSAQDVVEDIDEPQPTKKEKTET